jgi:hypothetical protein
LKIDDWGLRATAIPLIDGSYVFLKTEEFVKEPDPKSYPVR